MTFSWVRERGPVFEAESALALLHETIRAVVKIETRLHDLSLVLSTAAASDADAAAAWRDRTEVRRGAVHRAFSRIDAEGRLNPAWKLDEVVDMVLAVLSVDAYQQLIVERGWNDEALIRRVWELCETCFLVEPHARKASSKVRRPTR